MTATKAFLSAHWGSLVQLGEVRGAGRKEVSDPKQLFSTRPAMDPPVDVRRCSSCWCILEAALRLLHRSEPSGELVPWAVDRRLPLRLAKEE